VNPESSATDDWTIRLTADGPERDRAIADLTRLLIRGLTKSLSHRYGGGLQVEDVAQEAVIRILASLDQFAARSRFTTWAMTIATRIGISELRRKHCRSMSLDLATREGHLEIEVAAAGQGAPDGDVDRFRMLETLKELIDTILTEKQRLAMQGVLDGLPIEEIARRMESNRNAVYKLVHDARMRLRNGFEKAGISAGDVTAVFA
jgi:RNA polymerase sigma factor (sigma-70 family)